MDRQSARWRKWLPWLLVLAWYAVIFWFSAQPGDISDAQSQRMEQIARGGSLLFIPIRKWGHIVLFAVQGALCCNALYAGAGSRCGCGNRRGSGALRAVCIVLGICAVLGGLDEAHQIFVSERAAMIEDVGVDMLGGLMGALSYLGIRRLRISPRLASKKGSS